MKIPYAGKSTPELVAIRESLTQNPANKEAVKGSIHTLNQATRKKLEKIDAAIAANMAESRAKNGRPVPTCGYSGRKSNK